MTAAQLDSALWYFGRGAGVVALVLLTLSVLLGITTRSGRPLPGLPRFAVAEVHRSVGLLAAGVLAAHILSLVLDPQAQLRWIDTLVPLGAAWRPLWVGLGTLAVDLLVAVVATSLLRHRLGRRTWRLVHWAAYLLWPAAVAHALGSGTDAHSGWMLVLTAVCIAAVVAAGIWRLSPALGKPAFLDPIGRVRGTRRPVLPRREALRSGPTLPSSDRSHPDRSHHDEVLQA